jgi:adenylate cyclase
MPQTSRKIRILWRFNDLQAASEFEKFPILIGRFSDLGMPELDLTPDGNVSRRHARLALENEAFWIEDLGSRFGTQINGREIKDCGKQLLKSGDLVKIGDTTLQIDFFGASGGMDDEGLKITVTLDAKDTGLPFQKGLGELQKNLLEFPIALGAETKVEAILQLTVECATKLIPGAERGAVLLCARDSDALLLSAYVSSGQPAVSETLARRALSRAEGFVWRKGVEEVTKSVKRHGIESGMYAPLLWNGKPLGVLCVDNPLSDSVFGNEQLHTLLALAHYAAISVANHRLQEELRDKTKLLERLLTQFSPKIRERLLAKALNGRLRPGGEKSNVAILFSDIRGFTSLSASMDAGDVMDMLNDYLPALAEIIFKYDGTIDKFIGDAILAVFGSPEPDPRQSEKAVHAAWEMQQTMKCINEKRAARGDAVCQIGIGVHFGEVLHGFIGATERLEFTVIGDAVNRASRFCSAAKAADILISPEIYQRVFKFVDSEKTVIPTKHEGDLAAYRLTAWNAD